MSLEQTVKAKLAAKYDHELERKLRTWIGEVVPDNKAACSDESIKLNDLLKDGVILCKLINAIAGKPLTKPSTMKMAFKQMENISSYLSACEQLGLDQTSLFETLDLFEARDLSAVLANIHSLYFIREKYADALKAKADDSAVPTSVKKLGTPSSSASSSAPSSSPGTPQKDEPQGEARSGSTPSSPSHPGAVPRILAGHKDSTRTAPGVPQTSMMDKITIKKADTQATVKRVEAAPSVPSLADDIQTKEEFKYNSELELAAKKWIEAVLGEACQGDFTQWIKSGVILCKLINHASPNAITKIYEGPIAYKQMENINYYLKACSELGLQKIELFETPDLFSEKNLSLVINNIHVLAHKLQKKDNWNSAHIEDVRSKSLFSATLISSDLPTGDVSPRLAPTMNEEQESLLLWANTQLLRANAAQFTLTNLSSDVRDGVRLARLVQVVTKVVSIGAYNPNPSQMWHAMQNASAILRFLSSHTFEKPEGVRASDIVMGNVSAICRLLKFLRDKFDLDYLFSTLIGDDSVIASPVGDVSDEEEDSGVVEVELVEGEEVPEHLRKFIDATDLQALDEAKKKRDEEREGLVKALATSPVHAEGVSRIKNSGRSNRAASTPVPPRVPLQLPSQQPTDTTPAAPQTSAEPVSSNTETASNVPEPRDGTASAEPVDAVDSDEPDSDKPRSASLPLDSSKTPESTPPSTPDKKKPKNKTRRSKDGTKSPKSSPKSGSPSSSRRKIRSGIQEPLAEGVTEEAINAALASPKKDEPSRTTSTDSIGAGMVEPEIEPTSPISPLSPALSPRENQPIRKVKVHVKAPSTTRQPAQLSQEQQDKVNRAQATVRSHVVNELLQTEMSYVKSLQVLREGFINPIRKAKVISDDQLKTIVANIEQLHELHVKFSESVQKRVSEWNENSIVSDIFLEQTKFLENYHDYLSNYNGSIVAYHHIRQKNPEIANIQRAFEEEQFKSTMLQLESFLIMPVQRIPRYVLLLRDLRKYTPVGSNEHNNIGMAIQQIDATLQKLNANIDKDAAEHTRKLLFISNCMQGDTFGILHVGRRLLLEGEISVKKVRAFDKADKKKRSNAKGRGYWYIFNDSFVFCEPLKMAKSDDIQLFSFIHAALWTDVKDVVTDDKAPMKFKDKKAKETQFFLAFEKEYWIMQASTAQLKEQFVQEIRRAKAPSSVAGSVRITM